ncbi:MAG: glucokinase [Maritimibacter sp.]
MAQVPANTFSLLADIGGTNTRVALARGTELMPDTIRRYKNAQYPGLETVLSAYLQAEGQPDCVGACVAAAGPVRDGVATLTNLDWTITRESVGRAANAETVAVLNDLQAQGHALGHLADDALTAVVESNAPANDGTKLVIGVGTGLCHDLETVHGFPSVEEVLSGRGLENLYAWHARRAGTPTELSTAQVIEAAESGDALALETLKLFVRIFGTVTGNLSLIHLPFGGVFLIGGMARAVIPWMARFDYADAMRDKGRFAGFMRNFPVHVVDDDYAALTGCAHHLAHLLPS